MHRISLSRLRALLRSGHHATLAVRASMGGGWFVRRGIRQPGRLLHGVPRYLLWYKGSANTSSAIKELLRSLDVTPLEHAAGNARAKLPSDPWPWLNRTKHKRIAPHAIQHFVWTRPAPGASNEPASL